MATFAQQVFVVSVFMFVLINSVTSLQCYTCSSGREEVCDDTFSHHAYQFVPYRHCDNSPAIQIPGAGPNTHCGKTKNINSNSPNDFVFRGCVPENYCKLVSASVSECLLCDHDGCNSSSNLIPSIFVAITSLIITLRCIFN